jgi:hypothetical protein
MEPIWNMNSILAKKMRDEAMIFPFSALGRRRLVDQEEIFIVLRNHKPAMQPGIFE